MKLTERQKKLRRLARSAARRHGRNALDAINRALHPVYEDDGDLYERIAKQAARIAFGYAAASLLPRDLAQRSIANNANIATIKT